MFVNFELCQKGLVKAEPRRKHSRTTSGCLQCRTRKRKCDELRPICGGCVRFGSACSLVDTSPSSPSTSTSSSQSPKVQPAPSSGPWEKNPLAFLPSWESSMGSPYERTSQIHHRSAPPAAQPLLPLFVTLDSPFFKIFSKPVEQRGLQSLNSRFHPMTTLTYANPDFSILAQALPLALEYSAVKNAFLACGLALLFKASDNREEHKLALEYYNHTVNDIASGLMSLPEESNLAAVLLLHIFEEICCDNVQAKRLHLIGAQSLISSAFRREESSSIHMNLLLEAYIYHVVISGIFSGIASPSLPDNHVSEHLHLISKSFRKLSPGPLWTLNAILGLSHDLFDIAFRISQLRRRMPLRGPDLFKASELEDRLGEWEITATFDGRREPPLEMVVAANLYHLACLLLLHKLQNPRLISSDLFSRTIVLKAVEFIEQLPQTGTHVFVLMWPLLVVGSAAVIEDHRAIFRSPFERANGFGHAVQVARLLQYAWSFDDSLGRDLGLDVLFREDLACTICL